MSLIITADQSFLLSVLICQESLLDYSLIRLKE